MEMKLYRFGALEINLPLARSQTASLLHRSGPLPLSLTFSRKLHTSIIVEGCKQRAKETALHCIFLDVESYFEWGWREKNAPPDSRMEK